VKKPAPEGGAKSTERPDPALPNERDESADPAESKVNPKRRQRIAQAENDVERGLKDTEGRGLPSNVPGKNQ
jgi:hypothetical protein